MNRWILAIGLLLGAGLSLAHADYLRIIYNVGATKDPNNPSVPPGVSGLPGGAKFPGGVGGQGLPGGLPAGGPGFPGGNPGKQPPGLPGLQPKPGQPGVGQPGAGFPGNRNTALKEEDDNAIRADVVVEYKKREGKFLHLRSGPGPKDIKSFPFIFHKWGKTAITPTFPDIVLEEVKEGDVNLPPVATRYQTQRTLKLKDKDGKIRKTPEALLELAEWALNHAMLEEFTKIMEELREANASHPALKAFDQVQADLKKSVNQDDSALATWQTKLGNFKTKKRAHYVLLYNSTNSEPPEVDEYLDRLEDNMRGFFYWFALKEKSLPVPGRRLVAVLVDKVDEFTTYRPMFDSIPLVADGFYSKRENLAVFSAVRLDEAFELVTRATAPLQQNNWDFAGLLQGQGHPGASSPEEVIRNQMLALLLKALQEESSLATVSHDGTRQLVFSTGLLARNVAAPEWIQFGEASFFETPKGAFWPGIGAPNWKYGVKFKVWKSNKALDKSPDAIRKVISDQYFRDIKAETDKDAVTKARTMAWSLTYFLMNKKLDQLLRYFQEVNSLPRDMEFDADTLTLTFARAFDLVESSNPTQINDRKMDQLAKEWYDFIDLTAIESAEAVRDAMKRHDQKQKKGPTTKPPLYNPAMPRPTGTLPPGSSRPKGK
jgi:hypothetical protein